MTKQIAEHVLIVGAGTTGISAFIELIEHSAARKVDIVDPGPPGRGMAFANTRDELLCNTPAESMSLVSHDTDDFIGHLKTRGISASANDFVPRSYVSQYAKQRYDEYCSIAHYKGIAHSYISDRVESIQKTGPNRYQAKLEGGEHISVSHVLICHGYGKPMVPDILRPHIGSPNIFITPYPEQDLLNSMKPRSKVLVIGTRLSAIDAALLLAKHGHLVTMSSPSGEIPAVRTRAPDLTSKLKVDLRKVDFSEARCRTSLLRSISEVLREMGAPKLSEQISRSSDTIERLRAEVDLAKRDVIPWQDLLLLFLLQGNDMLAQDITCISQASLKKCMRMSTRYLSAIPVPNAEKMLAYLEQKKIIIEKSTPILDAVGEQWQASWNQLGRQERYDAVISAAGYTRPILHIDKNILTITPKFSGELREPKVSDDLRVYFESEEKPEQIWVIGVASYLRAPLVNGVFQATRQSEIVRRQLAQCG